VISTLLRHIFVCWDWFKLGGLVLVGVWLYWSSQTLITPVSPGIVVLEIIFYIVGIAGYVLLNYIFAGAQFKLGLPAMLEIYVVWLIIIGLCFNFGRLSPGGIFLLAHVLVFLPPVFFVVMLFFVPGFWSSLLEKPPRTKKINN
jgi:hypothetical protein